MSQSRHLPDCWGHRGASSQFPENTLASFDAAIRDGAEGIESDVHVSLDDVVVMFHDPALGRTTDSTGLIRERAWYGKDGMEHVRTVKEPKQAIPTFADTVQLLMLPENRHVKFNVDVKVQNDPDRLFSLMHKTISAQPGWETVLAPRVLLGLWHPRFLEHAKKHLPYCRRSYIGDSPYIARKYFWKHVDAFSMAFGTLTTLDGQRFRGECKAGGKQLMVWTVNEPQHMMEAVRWEVDAILTDVTKTWLELRAALRSDYDKIGAQYSRGFLWTTLWFYTPFVLARGRNAKRNLEKVAATTMAPSDSSRRAHRKRPSLRLSSDTTASSLPAYSISTWRRTTAEDHLEDQPPDYPDSAEEADDDGDDDILPFSIPPAPSPRRTPRRPKTHKRKQSSANSDQYLDSLLERSVHALELSNALLQSSMTTQTSFSGFLASDAIAEHSLDIRARGLSSSLDVQRDTYHHWESDLNQIRRGVEGLFGEKEDTATLVGTSVGSSVVSSSLPTTGLAIPTRRPRRLPSLDLNQALDPSQPGLHFSPTDRSHLVAPPPRAITQYVASSADPDSILLPSTIGLRSSGSAYFSGSGSDSIPYRHLHSSVSIPVVTERGSEPSTPAYNMLSSFVARPSSSGSSTPALLSGLPSIAKLTRRNSSSSSRTGRSHSKSRSSEAGPSCPRPIPGVGWKEAEDLPVDVKTRSRSPARTNTSCPPIEEQSSSSEGSCRAKRTVQCLRKILDEQPRLPRKSTRERLRAPDFLPRTPAPQPSLGTSTATASISRLYTKATHSSSTRPPSPPRSSALKHTAHPSPSRTPTRTRPPASLSILGVGARTLGGGGGASVSGSSGRSTPKRISFADLPESYTGSRAGEKRARAGRRGASKMGKRGSGKGRVDDDDGVKWWTTWLVGAGASGVTPVASPLSQEERVEERAGRGWRVGVGANLEDWAV